MILPDAVERFGPLSEAVQVKGAIALALISGNGMHLDVDRLEGVRAALKERLEDQVELLREPRFEGLLRLDRDGQLILTEKGHAPSLGQARLRELLEQAAGEVAGETGRAVTIPRTAKGNVSLKAEDWEDLAPFHPLVHAWIELGKTMKMLQFFGNIDGPVVRPSYTPLVRTGRTSCSSPNIQNLPRKGGLREAFVASPGHLLLIVDYGFIELRTLAAEFEARYGTSKLAEVIRDGVDPHSYTAAMFEGMGLEAFMGLKTSDREEDREKFALLRQRAKVLNFGIPGGLGPRSLVAYAKSTYGVTLTIEEAAEFRRRLIEEVYPELGLYLADDGMDVLAWNLGVPVRDCWGRFDWKGDRSGGVVGGIRNIVRGRTTKADGQPYNSRYYRGVWDDLIELNRSPELAAVLAARQGSEELFRRLFHAGVTTLTGRVRGRVGFTQARNTPFQGLAADGAKLALWDLIRAGYRVVAFVHDEVVVELPEGADHAAEASRIEGIMNRSMERVTGDIPVACEYALSRRWSKKAKAVFEGGRLVCCEVDPRESPGPENGGESVATSRTGRRFDSASDSPRPHPLRQPPRGGFDAGDGPRRDLILAHEDEEPIMTDIDAKIPAELAEWLEDREEMLLAYAEDRLPGEELEPVGFEVPGSAQPTISRIEDIREIEVLEMTDRGDGILEVECRLCTDLELALNDVEHGSVTTEAIVYLSLTIDVTAGRPVEHLLVSAHHPDY